MNYPEYVEVNKKLYKINVDFRCAIKCGEIAQDITIGEYERALAIIFVLFGEEGLKNNKDHEKLLELGRKFLLCGKEYDPKTNENPDMDYTEDYGLIWASMYSDYHGLDIDKEKIHWWKFNELLNGLSNNEFGNCCVLNRVRNLRNYDTKEIKDSKERKKIEDAKRSVALKKYQKEKPKANEEQLKSAEEFIKALGL